MSSCPALFSEPTATLRRTVDGYALSTFGETSWEARHGAQNDLLAVEVARTREEIRVGLMGRRQVRGGMLFVVGASPSRPSFWMKNTLVPLNMEFLDADLRVVDAHYNVQPHDLTPRRPSADACFVLETPAHMPEM